MTKLIKSECKKIIEGQSSKLIGRVERFVPIYNKSILSKIIKTSEQLINTNTPNLIVGDVVQEGNKFIYKTLTTGVSYEIEINVYDLD